MKDIQLRNQKYPLRLINFTDRYMKTAGAVLSDNKIITQPSKLDLLDFFFPSLLIRKLPDDAEEAKYDYTECYILAPRKQGMLSNLGSFKQKINNIEDCLLGNSKDEKVYKNYTVAHNVLRRASNDLLINEKLFRDIAFNLRNIYEKTDQSQKIELDAWLEYLVNACKEEKTRSVCTADRRDGLSFEDDVYDALIRRADSLLQTNDEKGCWTWLCIGCLFGSYAGPLLKKYRPDFSFAHSTVPVSDTYRLISSPSVITDPYFCGREEYLKKIHNMFSEGKRVIFLYGIGGIGKTEIAREYASVYKNEYDVIIYAVYEGSIRDLIIKDMPFETKPPLDRLTINGEHESDEAYFRRKLDLIKKVSDQRTLIIIDNFNEDTDDHLKDLIDGRYNLLFTSQLDLWRSYTCLRIDPIEDENALVSIFMNHYQGYAVEKNDPDLIRLIRTASCHTYTVVLLAHHMENSGQTAGEMIEALKEKGILSLNEVVSMTEGGKEEAYRSLVHMFSIFSFSEEEKRILQLLSLVPLSGIPPMVFRQWADLTSTRTIVSLEKRGWIIRSTGGIALHPVVRRVIHYVLPAESCQLASFLSNAADMLSVDQTWHFSLTEKQQYASIAASILSFLPEIDEYSIRFRQAAAVIYAYTGRLEEAVNLDQKLFAYTLEKEGEQSFETARASYRTGWAYLFNNQAEKAETWMLKTYELLQNIPVNTSGERTMYCGVLENLAKLYLKKYEHSGNPEDLKKAESYAEQNVALSRKWLTNYSKDKRSPAGSLLRLADIYMASGEYEKAEKLINEAHTILSFIYKDDEHKDPDILRATSRKAAVLYPLGKYSESLEEAEKNIIAYRMFYGDDNPSVFDQLVLKYRNCIRLGMREQAEETKKEALRLGGKLCSADPQKLQSLIQQFDDLT
ncbi:MAG: ATP-binding protein [Solobacterium sp.]|nr:ATP-binding protein [Solobacterium sp.]